MQVLWSAQAEGGYCEVKAEAFTSEARRLGLAAAAIAAISKRLHGTERPGDSARPFSF